MSGITNLDQLIASMEPVLLPQRYRFVSSTTVNTDLLKQAHAVIKESEGVTLILEESVAQAHTFSECSDVFACITLNVHSSLEAVGLTAAFATALGEHNISANVVAGFYHDHIYVANEDAEQAVTVLEALSRSKQGWRL